MNIETMNGVSKKMRASLRPLCLVSVVAMAGVGVVRTLRADAPPGHFKSEGGTVIDAKVHLEWQQTGAPKNAGGTDLYTWAEASAYCTSLSLKGGGWRLPSVKEMLSLIDRSQRTVLVDRKEFTDTVDAVTPGGPRSWSWTATGVHGTPGERWVMYFFDGGPRPAPPTNGYRVRCVRSVP